MTSARRHGFITGLIVFALSAVVIGTPSNQTPLADADALVTRAYDAAFGLDHHAALALARQAVEQAPDRATTHRALASVIWQTILFQRGAVTVDHFMPGMTDAQKHLPEPDPDLAAEFHKALERAKSLAEAQVERTPDEASGHYELGSAHGLEASYTASVEGSLTAAFRKAKRAFDAQESALERDSNHAHAMAVVGTYRYLVSSLGLVSRMFAYIAGFGGGKERGIGMLETAAANPAATMEAGTALVLIYSREDRHEEAYAIVRRLRALHPENRLLVLESGATALRAGHADEAQVILTEGLEALADDPRPRVPGERAIWLFKRGLARLELGRTSEAAADLRGALTHDPQGWVRGRIRAGLGKVADVEGDRDRAVAEYERAEDICSSFDDEACVSEARALIRRPFAGSAAGLQ